MCFLQELTYCINNDRLKAQRSTGGSRKEATRPHVSIDADSGGQVDRLLK